ncbi:MAG: N-methyl-L-tryptophan oxidase, partial [Planctomycetia bacterium]
RRHGLALENLSTDEVQRRFPGFRVPDGMTAVFESNAGYLMVEDAVGACLAEAERHGAELHTDEQALSWRVIEGGVEVATDRATYTAGRLVVAAGAWASRLLAELALPLVVLRKSLFWHEADGDAYSRPDAPGFYFDLPAGGFYGFPQLDARGVKTAEHTGGRTVDGPLTVDRAIDADEEQRLRAFHAECLPQLGGRRTDHAVCLYTVTPDRHFVVDHHPLHPQVSFAAGLSGHGYKFATVLGEILADLALNGSTAHRIDFLSCRRPALKY